jgi:hypothetical protein
MKDAFDFSFYSKMRVLSGDDYGKAVWILTFALHVSPPAAKEAPKASSPALKEVPKIGLQDEEIRDDEVHLTPRSNSQEGLPTKKDGRIDWSQFKVVPKK